MATTTTDAADLEVRMDAAIDAIHRLAKPTTLRQLCDARPAAFQIRSKGAAIPAWLEPMLNRLVQEGKLFRYTAGNPKQSTYFTRPEAEYLLEAVRHSLTDAPLTKPQLIKKLAAPWKHIPEKSRGRTLEQLTREAGLYQSPSSQNRRSILISVHPLEEQIDKKALTAAILQALAEKPLTKKQLEKKLAKPWKQVCTSSRGQLLDQLSKEIGLHRFPSPRNSRSILLSLRPLEDLRAYISKSDLKSLLGRFKSLNKHGVPNEKLTAALTAAVTEWLPGGDPAQKATADIPAAILERARDGYGANELVSFRELRESLDFVADKKAFDRAAIELARSGKVHLHRHDYPQGLSDQERNILVKNDRDEYFIGLVVREDGDA